MCIWAWTAAWSCPLWLLHVELSWPVFPKTPPVPPLGKELVFCGAVVKSGTAEETSHHVWTSGCSSAAAVGQRLPLALLAGSRSSAHLGNPQFSGQSKPWCRFYFSIFPPLILCFTFSFFQSQEAHGAARTLQVFQLSENRTYHIPRKLDYINDFTTFLPHSFEFWCPSFYKHSWLLTWVFHLFISLTEKKHRWRNSKDIHFFLRMWTIQFKSTPTWFNVRKQLNI